MRSVHCAMVALIVIALPLSGCKEKPVAKTEHPAKLEESGQKGIMKGESKYYVSLAHTQEDIDWTIAAWTDAIAQMKM